MHIYKRLDMKSNTFGFTLVFVLFSVTFALIDIQLEQGNFTFRKFSNHYKILFKYVYTSNKTLTQNQNLFEELFVPFEHSHKKQKDSLEGSLDRVLFAAELEFPKILVPNT